MTPLSPTQSGKAAFSLENLSGFLKPCSDAGFAPAFFLVTTAAARIARAA
jgi:hypothetical protein